MANNERNDSEEKDSDDFRVTFVDSVDSDLWYKQNGVPHPQKSLFDERQATRNVQQGLITIGIIVVIVVVIALCSA